MDDPRVALAALQERLLAVDQKCMAAANAAHTRQDKLEIVIRDELREMRSEFAEISKELKEVIGWMNHVKGWAAAMLLVAGVLGGLISKVF